MNLKIVGETPEPRGDISLDQAHVPAFDDERARICNRFVEFQRSVLAPLALALRELDPTSQVFITGSYVHSPEMLRRESDVDLIIFSSALRDPQQYVAMLESLHKRADEFENNYSDDGGVQTVFFTRINQEIATLYLAMAHSPRTMQLPCHMLFYPSHEAMLQREGAGMTANLIKNAIPVIPTPALGMPGNYDHLPDHLPHQNNLDNLRWDIERSLADYILGDSALPDSFRAVRFANDFLNSLRHFSTVACSNQKGDFRAAIKSIESQFGLRVEASFEQLLAVRRFGSIPNKRTLENLIDPAIELLQILNSPPLPVTNLQIFTGEDSEAA